MALLGFILFLQLLAAGFLLYEKIYLERFRYKFTSWFLVVYYATFILIPFLITCFLGGFHRVNTVIMEQYFDLDNLYILSAYQTILLIGFYIVRFLKYKMPGRYRVLPKGEVSFHFKCIAVMPFIGLGLFVTAVGSIPVDLMSTGRFSWFNDPEANIFMVAISQYFIAMVMLVCTLFVLVKKTKTNTIIFVSCLLVVTLYSLLSLDRKFIIFIVSGIFGGLYLRNYHFLKFSKKTITIKSNYISNDDIIKVMKNKPKNDFRN